MAKRVPVTPARVETPRATAPPLWVAAAAPAVFEPVEEALAVAPLAEAETPVGVTVARPV